MDSTELMEFNPAFKQAMIDAGLDGDANMRTIAAYGAVGDRHWIPEDMKDLFRTSHEIDPEWHVRMQAAFQKHTDNAVSKTINLPAEATVEDVETAYLLAYELGCKGITVYRDGSKDHQVLSTGQNGHSNDEALAFLKEHQQEIEDETLRMVEREFLKSLVPPEIPEITTLPTGGTVGQVRAFVDGQWLWKDQDTLSPKVGMTREPRSRPASMMGVTEVVKTGHGNMYVTINFDSDGKPFEVFGNLGKAGGCDSAQLEATSRMVSMALRSGIEADAIVKQLRGVSPAVLPGMMGCW